MKRIIFDDTRRQVLSAEVDLKNVKFHLSPRALIRIAFGSGALLFMAFVALYFEQTHMFWFSILFAVVIAGWQMLAFGFMGKSVNEPTLKVTNFYSKGTLITLAVFWLALITGIAIALYLKAT